MIVSDSVCLCNIIVKLYNIGQSNSLNFLPRNAQIQVVTANPTKTLADLHTISTESMATLLNLLRRKLPSWWQLDALSPFNSGPSAISSDPLWKGITYISIGIFRNPTALQFRLGNELP